ncbi:hypothetical protein G6F22_016168 [Rhizopus arrhizus]|nr:hypothetical protein G6F22_016168 [Rhizopus arrhizus]
MRAAVGRAFGRQHLGQHAAGADAAAGAAGHGFQGRVAGLRMRHELGFGVLAGIGVVQAALIGQDDQRVGLDQVGDQCAQRVVVAQPDLVRDDGVVFVDDRHHAQAQQREQRAASVEIAVAIGQVFVGQQDLRGAQAVLGECRFVGLAQAHLAYGRSRLQFVHDGGALAPTQPRHAFRDRAAGDQHDLLALLVQGGDLRGPVRDGGAVQASAFVGDQRRADFGDEALGVGDDGNGGCFSRHDGRRLRRKKT